MAKDSPRGSSSDDERELDGVAGGTDESSDVEDVDLDVTEDDADAVEDDIDLEDDDDLDDLEDDDDAEVAAGAASRRAGSSGATARKGRPAKSSGSAGRAKTSTIPGAASGNFLQQVGSELQKVVWPTRKQMITYTSVVLVFVVFLVAAIWVFDLGVGSLMDWIFA